VINLCRVELSQHFIAKLRLRRQHWIDQQVILFHAGDRLDRGSGLKAYPPDEAQCLRSREERNAKRYRNSEHRHPAVRSRAHHDVGRDRDSQ
jgi:hypothetical protein